MNIKSIFLEIGAEPGSNMKMEILAKHKSNDLLKRVLYLAKSPRIKFYIKQIPEYTSKHVNSLEWALDGLDHLSSRTLTGHDATKHLQVLLTGISKDDAYIIERIIEKDCKFGMGSTNINKIFPKLIEDTPYMGAKSFSEKLAKDIFKKGLAISQIKMDGRYANGIIDNKKVTMESRGGEPTAVEGAKFMEELKRLDDCVLNGELTMDGVPRYISNGLISSLVSIGKKRMDGENVTKDIQDFEKEYEMTTQKALDSIVYTVWDKISLDEYKETESKIPYDKRLESLVDMLKRENITMVRLVEGKTVKTYEEAMEHFQECLRRGEEGTILKSLKGTWKDGKPTWQIKMKLEMDVDLRIIGFKYGTGKNLKVISTIDTESSCGKLKTSPSGMTEKLMDYVTANQGKLKGMILEVTCSGLSHDSDKNYSLLHPRVKAIRDDKNTCDTLESIKEIEAMAKGLPKTAAK
jgi:hypothetical protein